MMLLTPVQDVISLVQALAWPLLVAAALVYFGREIRDVLRRADKWSLKAGGVEVQVAQSVEAAAALGAAIAARNAGEANAVAPSPSDITGVSSMIRQAALPSVSRRIHGASVLWVDDRPANNAYERFALEALGLHVTLSTSTEDAIRKLRERPFDVAISDMGRPPDQQAGYTLLDQMQKQKLSVPFIIYAGSDRPEHRAMARERGALDSTNHPRELVQLVVDAVSRDASPRWSE
jgi:CheY-like chemotaxis protein